MTNNNIVNVSRVLFILYGHRNRHGLASYINDRPHVAMTHQTRSLIYWKMLPRGISTVPLPPSLFISKITERIDNYLF